MKISSSTIGMESARRYQSSNKTIKRFMVKDDQEANTNTKKGEGEYKELKFSNFESMQYRYNMRASKVQTRTREEQMIEDIRQETIRYILDLLFGSLRRKYGKPEGETRSPEENQNLTTYAENVPSVDTRIGIMESYHYEAESTSFKTQGIVRTQDGREITFDVNVSMSREFQEYYKEDLKRADFQMCDPLVINMGTDVPNLTSQTYMFDLDGDGKQEEIASLSSQSGYLAFDKNGDGVINDGKELFGTQNGDGFADLARFDQDGNGWIDENDAIFDKLQIWTKDENGKDVLYRLKDKGIGAICLQKVATNFSLKNQQGNTLGAIRSTGIFLYENGMAGTVSHLDVAKRIYQMKA